MTAKAFKGLFNIHPENKTAEDKGNGDLPSFQEFVLVNWYEDGKTKAQSQGGSEAALKVCIAKIYCNHKEILRRDAEEQETAKEPYRAKVREYTKKNEEYEKELNRINADHIPKIKERMERINSEITDIRANPDKYIKEVGKGIRAGFIIGCVILLFLTVYLFIFYSSASYSAFFKQFTLGELGVVNSIFDAQALSKALRDGFTELLLILTIPFVFLGLGYLIHKFQEQKGWQKIPKITLLVLVTFIFDCILAYEITDKIYGIQAENSFQDMPPYSVSLASQNVSFWLIIFAGFVVYLIWGFVFNFSMEEYDKLDRINALTSNKQKALSELDRKLDNYDEQINKLNQLIAQNNIEIGKLDIILSHAAIIKPKELEFSLMRFLEGWLEYLNFSGVSESERENARSVVEKFIGDNIKSLQIEATTEA